MSGNKQLYIVFFASGCWLTGHSQATLHKADSLFLNKDYRQASILYAKLLGDTSTDALHLNRLGFAEYSAGNYTGAEQCFKKALTLHPVPPVKASILSRLARTSAYRNNEAESEDYLDSAVNNGYFAVKELDTVKDFAGIRSHDRFKQIRARVYNSLFPCMNDARSREFDFWIGEWNVCATGTSTIVGHSLIQKVSGGCALLENWSSAASEGKSLNFIDDSSKRWKQVWIGSYAAGKQDFVDGIYKDSAMIFRFTTTNAAGNKVVGRFSFFNQGPTRVRQLNELSADGGNTWTVQYDFTYQRKD